MGLNNKDYDSLNNIDDFLKLSSLHDVQIPNKVNQKIEHTLLHKDNKKSKKGIFNARFRLLRNAVVSVIATIIICVTSFSVYASFGGTIEGIPAFEWLNIKFGSNMDSYKKEILNQTVKYDETSVSLVSATCLEYVTLFEFDVKLSDEDKEFLRLGESVLMQKDFDDIDKNYERTAIKTYINSGEVNDILDSLERDEYDEIDIEKIPENIKKKAVQWYDTEFEKKFKDEMSGSNWGSDKIEEMWEMTKKTKETDYKRVKEYDNYINTIMIGFNKSRLENIEDWGIETTIDDGNPRHDYNSWDLPHTKDPIIVDGEKTYSVNYQTVVKIADNEYKIYYVCLITDEDLDGKTNFNVKFSDIVIANEAKLKEGVTLDNSSHGVLVNTPNNTRILRIDGEFSADLDKNAILQDSKEIKNIEQISQYKNITESIDEILVSPIQTVIKTKTVIENVNTDKEYDDTENIQNPLWMDYNITDENGNKIENASFQTKKFVTLLNGKKEEWAAGDIERTVKNATVEYITYTIIETTNAKQISIEPFFKAHTSPKVSDEKYKEYNQTLPEIVVDL